MSVITKLMGGKDSGTLFSEKSSSSLFLLVRTKIMSNSKKKTHLKKKINHIKKQILKKLSLVTLHFYPLISMRVAFLSTL